MNTDNCINYNFIIIAMEDVLKNIVYGVKYTTRKPRIYMASKKQEWLKTGFRNESLLFYEAFKSWKGHSKIYILENHLKYHFIKEQLIDKNERWQVMYMLNELADLNAFANEQWYTYLYPPYESDEIQKQLEKIGHARRKLYKEIDTLNAEMWLAQNTKKFQMFDKRSRMIQEKLIKLDNDELWLGSFNP